MKSLSVLINNKNECIVEVLLWYILPCGASANSFLYPRSQVFPFPAIVCWSRIQQWIVIVDCHWFPLLENFNHCSRIRSCFLCVDVVPYRYSTVALVLTEYSTLYSQRASKFLDRAAASSNFLVRAVFFNPPAFTFAGFKLSLCIWQPLYWCAAAAIAFPAWKHHGAIFI